jgi:hypothetical protein
MRVLHLFEQHGRHGDCPTLNLAAQALGRLGSIEQTALLLGAAPLAERAAAAQLVGARRVAVPRGRALFAFAALRGERFDGDIVHAWSPGALTFAALRWRQRSRAMTLTVPPSGRLAHWLRMVCQEGAGRTVILPISHTIRRELIAGGVPEDAVHVVRPALDMGLIPHQQRGAIRQRWGIESDDVKVFTLLADPLTEGDVLYAARAMMLAADSYPPGAQRLRLLVHPDHKRRTMTQRLLHDLGREDWLIIDEAAACPWNVLPGCDIALATGPSSGNLSLLWAMAANVPIIADANYAVSEIVEDRHSALLAKPGEVRMAAHRINQLLDDPHLAWQLRDQARHEAYSFFSRRHYCRCLEQVYAQLTDGEPIDVPPMQVTGGLRFTGRV